MSTRKFPFIVIEGLDGTGKTTLRKNLYRLFDGIYDVTPLCLLTTNFLDPSAASDIVDGKYNPGPGNAATYMAALRRDKAASVTRLIAPALAERPVIADRWILSEMAFFAVKHGSMPTETYHGLAPAITIPADITFIIDVSTEVAMERASSRLGDAVRADWDVLKIQTSVQQVYTAILETPADYHLLGQIAFLDGNGTSSSVLDSAWSHLLSAGLLPELPL